MAADALVPGVTKSASVGIDQAGQTWSYRPRGKHSTVSFQYW